jgi:hypothetical protein
MAIAKGRPETGFRIALERATEEPLVYEGTLQTPEGEHAIRIEGDIVVGCDADVADKIRLLVRTAIRHAESDGRRPPLRITRWRP